MSVRARGRLRYRFARVGELRVHYELADYTAPWRSAPAETVLLHHGYARNLLFWQAWVPLLAAEFRVLRFDARGCGATRPAPEAAFSLEQLAADALGLIDALGIARVHWVGESSGGMVGMVAALAAPARIATLTLCDTPFRRSREIARTYTLGEESRAAAFERYGVRGWCRRTLSYRLDTARAAPELCEWYAREMGRTPRRAALAWDRAIAAADLWERLPDVATPTLILAGALSPIAREPEVRAMRERMRAVRLVLLPGYGHGVHLLAPERCAAEMRRFLGELGSACGPQGEPIAPHGKLPRNAPFLT